MKVFIADDSPRVRRCLTAMISKLAGIEVVGQAGNGIEALDKIRELRPDAIILDIRMPEMGGIDVLGEIKKNGTTATVLIITNYPYPQYREKCMGLGADYFFDKSLEFEKIPEVLQQLIEDSPS